MGLTKNHNESLYERKMKVIEEKGGGKGLEDRRMGSSMSARCRECGNRAKKECVYMRCRTCCNNKGFHCQTHVKSTWVPLYKRSLFHQQQHSCSFDDYHQHHHHEQQQRLAVEDHLFINNPSKRPRGQHNPSSSSAGLDEELGNELPAEVNAMAKFQGVRVSSMENMQQQEQYAYQTSVVIGGHLFKGILYDQGRAMMTPSDPSLPACLLYQLVNPFHSNHSMPSGTQFFQNLSS